MDIHVTHRGEITVLLVRGRLDAAASPILDARIEEIVEQGTRLVLNLDQVDYLSSAGMRLLLAAAKKLDQGGGKLVVACVRPELMEVLRMAGFDRLLAIAPTEAEAVELCQS